MEDLQTHKENLMALESIDEETQKVSDDLISQIVSSINQTKVDLIMKNEVLSRDECQDFIGLNLPYNIILGLIKSMFEGRTFDQKNTIYQLLRGDISDLLDDSIEAFETEKKDQIDSCVYGCMSEITKALDENQITSQDDTNIFLTKVFSDLILNSLENSESCGHSDFYDSFSEMISRRIKKTISECSGEKIQDIKND